MTETPCDYGVHVLCSSPDCTCQCDDHTSHEEQQ
jgi:hypothetical protein